MITGTHSGAYTAHDNVDENYGQIASTQASGLTKLAEFFEPVVARELQKVREATEKECRLIAEYYESGLTIREFARERDIHHDTLWVLLRKYDVPARIIDEQVVKRIQARARKTRERVLCTHEDCLACKLIRIKLAKQSRGASGEVGY